MVVEASLLVDVCLSEVGVEESVLDVGVEEADELVCEGVELGEEDEDGVEVGVFEGEVDESLVGVADVLAGVVELAAALLPDVDEPESLVSPTSDNAPETTEPTIPCLLLKMFASNQLACVRAKNTARMDSRRSWGRENIIMMVWVLMQKRRWKVRRYDEEVGCCSPPSYSRFVRMSGGFAELCLLLLKKGGL